MLQIRQTTQIHGNVGPDRGHHRSPVDRDFRRHGAIPEPAEKPAPQLERPLKVAVAEDEVELREYFGQVLPHLGYDLVAIAGSGEELVRLCDQSQPEIVIADVQLVGISGPEAVATIRDRCWVAAVYIAENSFEDMAAKKAVEAAVLPKPFRMAELPLVIQQALELCPGDSQRTSNRTEVKNDGSP